MTAPPREPQNLYDALSTIYDWLCDDRLTQWPYMENGPFYSDLPKYQEVARAALAAAPAPSAEQRAPVRVPCQNKVDGVCPLPNVHCAYPKCTEGTAPLSHVTPAGPPAPDLSMPSAWPGLAADDRCDHLWQPRLAGDKICVKCHQTAPRKPADPPATDAPCSSCGQTAGFHTLRCRDKNAASELRATHCSNEGLHDSAADLIERQAREIARLDARNLELCHGWSSQNERAERAESALADKARILERCRFVLGNMAQENVGAIFNRWPISHEPLRNDARGLLPDIDAVLGDSNG